MSVPNEATRAVLLEVLNRHLEKKPHERAEMTIKEVKHEIVSSELDLLVKDTSSAILAARLILTLRSMSQPGGEEDQSTTKLAAHITTTTTNPHQYNALVILDDAARADDQGPPPPAAPICASVIPTQPRASPATTPLADTYKSYIETFMAKPPATALTGLPRFLHEPVVHNKRSFSIPEYHNLIEEARDILPDIGCSILDLIADEERQVVAARLKFHARSNKPPRDGPPRRSGPSPGVSIPEIVFYWFNGGKIREVVSLVDLDTLEEERGYLKLS